MKPIVFGIIGAASVILVALLALVVFQGFLLFRREKKEPILPLVQPKGKESASFCLKIQDRGRVFTFNEVEDLSEGFSNHIGDGTTYLVFKGILNDGTEVAVKRMRENLVNASCEAVKFHLQIELLYRVHHQHIINSVGYCDQKPHRILLCQYAPNGSLYEMLHGEIKDELLTWKQRLRIAMGISYGLCYLHHSCNPPIIHGELTSVNILLTEDFAAKITGLGKVPLLRATSELQIGSKGMSKDNGQVDQKSVISRADDVHSFGIILLELLSGRRDNSEGTGKLAEWAMPFLTNKEQMMDFMDPALKNVQTLEFCAICEIARLCIQSENASRPAMTDVMEMLLQVSNISVEIYMHMSQRRKKQPSYSCEGCIRFMSVSDGTLQDTVLLDVFEQDLNCNTPFTNLLREAVRAIDLYVEVT